MKYPYLVWDPKLQALRLHVLGDQNSISVIIQIFITR